MRARILLHLFLLLAQWHYNVFSRKKHNPLVYDRIILEGKLMSKSVVNQWSNRGIRIKRNLLVQFSIHWHFVLKKCELHMKKKSYLAEEKSWSLWFIFSGESSFKQWFLLILTNSQQHKTVNFMIHTANKPYLFSASSTSFIVFFFISESTWWCERKRSQE